ARRFLSDAAHRRHAGAAAQRGRRCPVGPVGRGDRARELRLGAEAARDRTAGDRLDREAGFFVVFSSAARRLASVGALLPYVAFRSLCQVFSAPMSSTSRLEMIERGATSVTSTLAFAYLSRCLI